MGWIKANLDEDTHEGVHDDLRTIVENCDKPTHEVAAFMIANSVRRTKDEKPEWFDDE